MSSTIGSIVGIFNRILASTLKKCEFCNFKIRHYHQSLKGDINFAMTVKDSYTKVFAEAKRVMVVMSHPDDAEVFAAGTIARLVKSGVRVRVVKMTSGSRGSRQNKYKDGELSNLRESEDTASMAVLGVLPEDNIYFQIEDGEVENDLKTIGRVAEQIRLFKPDVVITQNPDDIITTRRDGTSHVNHRDHRNTARSVIDAAYPYARDISFFPEHFKNSEAQSHKVERILLSDSHDHPEELFIEVTSVMETRKAAISCHKSQFDPEVIERVTYHILHKQGKKYFERFRYAKVR